MIAYAPGTQISSNMCESAAKDCPLVVLFHALGAGINYFSYENLGRHLASYGFVVASVEWQDAESQANQGKLLPALLASINGGLLGLIKIVSDRLVLVGHSAGGFVVERSVDSALLISTGFKLSTVVLMSPASVSAKSSTYTDPAIDALLVLHDVTDSDPFANGGTSEPLNGVVPLCGVLAYELAGHPEGGDINSSNPQFAKHFIYACIKAGVPVKCPPDGMLGTHYYQDHAVARGYIAAFLLAYVRGHTIYKSYFRSQQPMTGIADVEYIDGVPGIWHMHAEPSEFTIIDWASPMAMAGVKGADKFGVITLPQEDSYTLNHGRVLRVQFTRGKECTITIEFAPTAKLVEYAFISFGLCQSNAGSYDDATFSAGALAGSISLASTQSGKVFSAKLHEIGGALWYRGCLKSRKVCAEDRVLPLSSVAQSVKLESIDQISIRIDAFDNLGQPAVVHVGNVKLMGKGP